MARRGKEGYEQLLEDIRVEFPRFRLIQKSESPLHKFIHRALWCLTFGQMTSYLEGYQTTLGSRVYVTSDWTTRSYDSRIVILRHELIHIRQFKRYTFLGMALLYLLVPLPMGLSYFRALFEKEAYAESIRATAEINGPGAAHSDSMRRHIIQQFTGASYGWMWPFPKDLHQWYDDVLASLDSE